MRRRSQKKAEIEHRRWRVSELFLRGATQAAIARELDVSQSTVSGDIKALRKEWRENRIDNVDELIAEEQKRLQQIEQAWWAALERSQQPLETTRIFQKNGEKRAEKLIRQQAVDARLLGMLLRASERRCALLGLNAQAAKSAAPQATVNQIDWERLFEETAEDLQTIEQKIAEAGKPGPKSRRKP
jgi:predicted transcriptional regulator